MKKTVWFLSIFVVLLGTWLAYSNRLNVSNKENDFKGIIIKKSDKGALSRMNTLYERFMAHKDDYLVIIGSNIDSGPVINNISSNGKAIVWINDATRDVYANESIEVYKCKNLNRTEENETTVFSVSNCEGFKESDIKGSIAFSIK
ncbi:DUF4362 domain-containing protein [Cohnella sp. JJ-181]|uniref:DUF4362 domain-containing protein n=1 Tax=Cohnella rhizoplanae TaxID=2974897 RepID=UPI00232C9559|nr:DUF4362 domain-containing protein [Cohnella sp. JJ-181]